MNKIKLQVSVSFFAIVLSACSATNRNVANVDEELVIPPSLAIPEDIKAASSVSVKPQVQQPQVQQPQVQQPQVQQPQVQQPVKKQVEVIEKQQEKKKVVSNPQEVTDGLYYIIVGTYPSQVDAIGTFSRISTLGLKQPAMESRRTKSGTLLHMVRLGPYSNQKDIDKAKNGLTNSGISGFKLVKS